MRLRCRSAAWAGLLTLSAWVSSAAVAAANVEELLSAIMRVKAEVPADARTAATLGREREGSGILIDQAGLVLTIGYLMVEAHGVQVTAADGRTVPAEIVAYDHDTGFGLLRTIPALKVKPLRLGRSSELKEKDPVIVAAHGGPEAAGPAFVVSKRTFAGSWEYLLDGAIFTAPPHPTWSGAALIDRDGRLVGVGSLIVADATGTAAHVPGNMFVPIDALKPVLAELIADGRTAGPARPWLGLNTEEVRGRLFVTRVSPGSPAERAGLGRGDVVLAVGGEQVGSLAEFYRKVWARGDAGVEVPLTVLQGGNVREVAVRSIDRRSHLRLGRTY